MKNFICRLFFSPLLKGASKTKIIAYISVATALSIVCNTLFELKLNDIQFSLTIAVSCFIGVTLGACCGAVSCFVGDIVGYMINSWGQLYLPWVGLSTACIALISGVIINGISLKGKGSLYIKIALFCALSFLICTIGINSTGFYFYYLKMGFSESVINYVNEYFGSNVGYFGYIAYRLILKGQILNSLINYVLIFALLPIIINNKKLVKGEKKSNED